MHARTADMLERRPKEELLLPPLLRQPVVLSCGLNVMWSSSYNDDSNSAIKIPRAHTEQSQLRAQTNNQQQKKEPLLHTIHTQ